MFRLAGHVKAGAAIRAARLESNITARVLAETHGLSQAQVSRVEGGHQEYFSQKVMDRFRALAQSLDVSISFSPADWRNAPKGHGKDTARPGSSGAYWDGLEWGIKQGYLSFEHALAIAARVGERMKA